MPMPQDKLTVRGRAARARICEAAEPVFAARGFHGANVRELAAAADVPTASLLHHYPTKEKLYAAVLGAVAAELEELFVDLDGARPHRDRLAAAIEAYLDWSARCPARSNLLLRELRDNPARLEAAGGDVHLVLAPLVERLSRFIRSGQRAGAFRKVSPVVFITHLVGGASYFCAARPTFERLVTDRQRARLASRFRRELAPLILEPLVLP